MPDNPSRTSRTFPWWVILGGLALALLYLPTLGAPFDFIDDGNLVYPAPADTTLPGHVELWWAKVKANVVHLGPFRPVVWTHWELAANTLGDDPLAWRAMRLGWCAVAATMLLWLMRELKLHPVAALVATAAAMGNPYRNEIWTSLTLAEGVAMPYALFALVAVRRAGRSRWPWVWDVAAGLGLLAALGCKNTFAALVPAMLVLRLWPDGTMFREGLRRYGLSAATYLLPLALPAAHFAYFQLHWHPGQYETPGPTMEQVGRMASWLKGAAGLDFLGVGVVLVVLALWWTSKSPPTVVGGLAAHRPAILCGTLLLVAGYVIYLPVHIAAARYTMPAVWGFDVLFALLLTALIAAPDSLPKRVAWTGVGVGLIATVIAGVGRQEKVAARSRMLWTALHHVEATAPAGARIAWMSGDVGDGALGAEEGIHFSWHLLHRGRGDVRIGLFDERGHAIERVELPPLDAKPVYQIAGRPESPPSGWVSGPTFAVSYRLGRKRFTCRLDHSETEDRRISAANNSGTIPAWPK